MVCQGTLVTDHDSKTFIWEPNRFCGQIRLGNAAFFLPLRVMECTGEESGSNKTLSKGSKTLRDLTFPELIWLLINPLLSWETLVVG